MKREDALKFVEDNKGKYILIHGEYDITDTWDDGEWVYDTSNKEMYNQLLDTIKTTSYIHGIKVYDEGLPKGVFFKNLDLR